MPTLAQTLGMTQSVSPLLRKARNLGIGGVPDMLSLAATRGCKHYSPTTENSPILPGADLLSDTELTLLLLLGQNKYNPTAIRCAAQLARSPHVGAASLAKLAIMERCQRVLAHIARAGVTHDVDGKSFWLEVLSEISPTPERVEPELPHWSRFVTMPGIQRGGIAETRWLTPHT